MKKILTLTSMFLVTLLLAGCGNANLDLTKVQEKVEKITVGDFDRLTASAALSYSEFFGAPVELYDWDLKDLNINVENIEQKDEVYDYSMAVDGENGYAYFIGKAKNKTLKKELDAYFKAYKEVLKKEKDGYTIYLASSNNGDAFRLLEENCKMPVYGDLMYVDAVELGNVLGISEELLEEHLVAMPTFITSASQYIILKPAEGKKEEVKNLMTTYMSNLQEQWNMYLPDQAELVKNRKEATIGEYLVYIISTDNDAVLKTIKDCKK